MLGSTQVLSMSWLKSSQHPTQDEFGGCQVLLVFPTLQVLLTHPRWLELGLCE